MHQSNWRVGLPLALITAFLWALLPIAMKGLITDMDSTTVTWFRFFGAALFAGAWYGWRRDLQLGALFRGKLLPYTLLAVGGLLGNYIAYATGLNYITPGALQVLIQLAPLLLLIFSVIWLGERFSARQWMGVALVCMGLPLFFNLRIQELLEGEDRQYLIGVGLVVIAAATWAVYGLFQKKILAQSRPQNLLMLIYVAGSLCFLPVSNPTSALQLDALGWGLLLFLTANTLIAYSAFAKAMAAWEASRVSATLALVPLMTLALSAIIGALWPAYIEVEPMNWISWVGAFTVVLGSLLAAIGRGR
ncbi:DMT family transporter [Microbulbifer hydrolyticus]|uniref:Drug/metabolite transporter (DMT)-like permease n=1 Tax=Microbulbifer hydrolyticus TaxID=48074 RepID=A0A6P1T9X5_9GAMM|nr:DMT family transporter [Microbulbifer hydrolyticus]MBB5212797.1 drug/metabolite transporter (DMT)-like permease [Microbulbifer hydrolyticus]QHQ38406.1 EamA family transporter [Microbulbifer hydrolyticus]